MKPVSEVTYACANAMFKYLKYLKNNDTNELVKELRKAEKYCFSEYGKDKTLWFKFGQDDTLATTISDIANDLNLPSKHSNKRFLIERFEMVTKDLKHKNELQVFFS